MNIAIATTKAGYLGRRMEASEPALATKVTTRLNTSVKVSTAILQAESYHLLLRFALWYEEFTSLLTFFAVT